MKYASLYAVLGPQRADRVISEARIETLDTDATQRRYVTVLTYATRIRMYSKMRAANSR